jgi:hypothetical protein
MSDTDPEKPIENEEDGPVPPIGGGDSGGGDTGG